MADSAGKMAETQKVLLKKTENHMKNKFFALIPILLAFTGWVSAENSQPQKERGKEKNENLSIYLNVSTAYYPKSAYKSGGTHFSPITGTFSGAEGAATLSADLKIPAPLGRHWLLRDANLLITPAIELSPITVKSLVSANFTPLPFLSFSAGGSIGTGWHLFTWQGIAGLNKEKILNMADGSIDEDSIEYGDYTAFTAWYYDFWAQGTFMFDSGAVFPGEWNHVIFTSSLQLIYKRLSKANDSDIWEWQNTVNCANGLQYYGSSILAYQMPLKLYRVGIMTEFSGYAGNSYGDLGKKSNYNSRFTKISFSPLAQVKLTKKDSLLIIAQIASRRSFEEKHEKETTEPYLSYEGYEWFFNRFAIRWTHIFK